MNRLIIVGSIIVDIPLRIPRFPDRGADVLAEDGVPVPGGSYNVAFAASQMGIDTLVASPVGSGIYGSLVLRALASRGIGLLGEPRDQDTGLCVTAIERDGERTFFTRPGVEAEPSLDEFNSIDVAESILFVSGYDLAYPSSRGTVSRWLDRVEDSAWIFLDPGPLVAEIPEKVLRGALKRARVLSLNLREAQILLGQSWHPEDNDSMDPLGTVLRLRELVGDQVHVVVRAGARGAAVGPASHSGVDTAPAFLPSPRVTAIDSTGAGDTHSGVLCAGLISGLDILSAVAHANVAAALSVTRQGPATAPSAEELAQFFAD